MATVRKSALVSYSAQQMYQLVNDVDSYSDFLPWCRSSRFIDLPEKNSYIGEIEIAKAGLVQSFRTRNNTIENERIRLTLDEGPFKHLQGVWEFINIQDNSCKILFNIEFKFSSQLMNTTFGLIFSSIADNMVDSFIKRAKQIYGG